MYPNVGILIYAGENTPIGYRVGFISAVCGQNGHLVNV